MSTKKAITPVRGLRVLITSQCCKENGPRTLDIGSGKVAGKVLIVDYGVGYAKLLILLES